MRLAQLQRCESNAGLAHPLRSGPTHLAAAWLRAGSHTVLSLLDHGYSVTIIDNLDNSFEEAYSRMKELAGDKASRMKFLKASAFAGPAPSSDCRGERAPCLPAPRPPARALPTRSAHSLLPQGDLRHLEELDSIFATEK